LCLDVAFRAIAIPVVLGVVLACAGGCVVTASAVWLCERRELRGAVEQLDAADTASRHRPE
jgi:hypothetical protein